MSDSPSRSPAEPAGGWQGLIDDLPAVVWEAEPQSLRIRWVSAGAERVLGYPRQRWIEDPSFWVSIIHPADRDEAVAYCLSHSEAGVDHEFEYRAIRADGEVVWLRDLVRVGTDETGHPISLRGMMVDVTEARRTADALRDEKSRYRLLADHVIDMVSLHDAAGNFLFASPSSEAITGYTPEELEGRHLSEMVHPEDLPELARAIQAELNGVNQPSIIFRVFNKSGELRWLETKGAVATQGETPGEARLVGVTRDFSERKALQEELARAQRLESLGRLAGGIAHDFNNLLTIVRGHLDLMRDGLPNEAAQAFANDLEEMDSAVHRASSLTRQLLTFGRRDVPRPRALDLGAVVQEMGTMLRRLLPESIHFEESFHPEELPVRLDPAQLEQILMNLVMNARDAMPEGGSLSVTTGVTDLNPDRVDGSLSLRPGRYAWLEVRDSGGGMSQEVQARIFEPFFTTKGSSKGTGLGLAIVYGAVRQAGGEVTVTSSAGEGTCFRLLFPLFQVEAFPDPVEEPARGSEPSAEAASRPAARRILLVEEDPGVLGVMRSIVQGMGFQVDGASSLEEALATYLRGGGELHLLLTSSVLPRGTGAELAARLRKDLPELPVIYMVDSAEEDSEAPQAKEANAILLSRPVTADGLARAVGRALD